MSVGIPHPEFSLFPTERGRIVPMTPAAAGVARFPGDPVGSFALRLTNVVSGSRYRIERISDGSLATPTANAEGTISTDPYSTTLDFYADGSDYNTLRIKLRKATGAPKYQPFETQVVAAPGSQSVYIAQDPDPIA